MSKRTTLIALSILCSITLAAPAVAGITPEQKCASAKMKATGKKFAAKAKCHAKALSQSAPVVADCLQLAETKFDSAFTKAESGGACLHNGDAATIEAKLDAALNDIVGDIGCGNGQLEGDEACDDGNLVDGDGCSSLCVEDAAVCGDGIIEESSELCDDGNTNDGDGCNGSCVEESGFECTGAPSTCSTVCGDGVIAGSEGCDDGNVGAGDGCSDICQEDPGFTCIGQPSVCTPTCVANGGACNNNSECCSENCVIDTCAP